MMDALFGRAEMTHGCAECGWRAHKRSLWAFDSLVTALGRL